jgi:hypothetical protein
MQRLIGAGCQWPVPTDSDPATGRLAGEAGVQYALRIRNACLVAAAFADAANAGCREFGSARSCPASLTAWPA